MRIIIENRNETQQSESVILRFNIEARNFIKIVLLWDSCDVKMPVKLPVARLLFEKRLSGWRNATTVNKFVFNKDAYERICSFYYHTKWWSCRDEMNFCLRSFLSSSADHWTRGEIEIPIEISGDLNAPTRNNAPVIPRYCILYELLRANEQFEVISIFELFRFDERLVKLFSRYF